MEAASIFVVLYVLLGAVTAQETVTIYDIQVDSHLISKLDGKEVKVDNVVVTGIFGKNVYVQQIDDATEYAGLLLYQPDPLPEAVGDLVTIQGTVSEYKDATQMYKPSVTLVGANTELPAPVIVLTGEVGDEKYEAMLIKVQDVEVVDPNADEQSGKDYGEFLVDDGSGVIRVDDGGDITIDPVGGEVYAAITGVVAFTHGNFKITPRDDNDFVVGTGLSGGGEPTPPVTSAPVGITAVTIPEVQKNSESGAYDGLVVSVTDAQVTAVFGSERVPESSSFTVPTEMYVQSSSPADEFDGILVNLDQVDFGMLPVPKVGDFVEFLGTVQERFEVTQIVATAVPQVTSAGNEENLPPPLVVPTGEAGFEKYEGMLVSFVGAKCTDSNADSSTGGDYGEFLVDDGSGPVRVHGENSLGIIHDPIGGEIYESIIGVMHYSYGSFKLLPRHESTIYGHQDIALAPDPTEAPTIPTTNPTTVPSSAAPTEVPVTAPTDAPPVDASGEGDNELPMSAAPPRARGVIFSSWLVLSTLVPALCTHFLWY